MDQVKSFMNKPVVAVRAKTSVFDATKRMEKQKTGAILVTEGKEYVGIFTEADLLRKVVSQGEPPDITEISTVMTVDIIFIDAESSMLKAFTLMQENNIRHLVVKENDKIVGVLSIRDIATYCVNKFNKPKK